MLKLWIVILHETPFYTLSYRSAGYTPSPHYMAVMAETPSDAIQVGEQSDIVKRKVLSVIDVYCPAAATDLAGNLYRLKGESFT